VVRIAIVCTYFAIFDGITPFMARAFILFVGGLFVLGSCTQRAICPAYQSAYIYDKDELRKKFSYFQEDSTPKVLTASKNRYLIAEPTPYRKKLRELQTVEMKQVPVSVPDSLVNKDSVSMEDLDRAARSVIDSTFIQDVPQKSEQVSAEDSIYVITRDKELRLLKYNAPDSLVYDEALGKYVAQRPEYYVKDVRLNIEQDNYMWYLRDYLVLPDVRLARIQQNAGQSEEKTSKPKEKKGFKGFFKDLFKKKSEPVDSTETQPAPPEDEFDFIDVDTLAQAPAPAEEPEAQQGFFSPRKKKAKGGDADDAIAEPGRRRSTRNVEAVREEEEEEEGF